MSTEQTLAAAMANILRHYGCEEIYGIGGDYAASLIQGLEAHIELCPSSNETHAGYSACASAELYGLGCCLTTFMVGSIPCMSAAALAIAENLSVIFISGAPGRQEISEPIALHHSLCTGNSSVLSYDNAINAFRGLGIRAERLSFDTDSSVPAKPTAAEQFAELVQDSLNRKQPVFLEIPRDMVFTPASTAHLSAKENGQSWSSRRFRDQSSELLERLHKARFPILYLGDKFKQKNYLCQIILEFCRKYRIPFVCDPCAKGIFNDQDVLSLGVYNGIFTEECTRKYVEQKADLVLEIGTSTIPRDICVALKTGTQLIHGSPHTYKLADDCSDDELAYVLQDIMKRQLKPFEFAQPEFNKSAGRMSESKLTVDSAMEAIIESQKRIQRPFIFLPEIGSAFFSSFKLKTSATSLNRGWLSNPWYGAMGTSLPYARAVARAIKRNKSRDIPFVITGDGGLHFQLNELAHFQREHLSVLILLFRNNIFGLGKSSNSFIYESCSPEFNINLMIEAYGGKSINCQDLLSLRQALDSYSCDSGIRLIEINVLQEDSNSVSGINDLIKSKTGCKKKQ